MSSEINEIAVVIIGGTIVVLLMIIFIIGFFVLHNKRQQAYILEKAKIESAFQEEILRSENQIREQTMKNISRELHDNIAQMLTLVKINLNGLTIKESKLDPKLSLSKEYINTIITDLRGLSKTLNSENILQDGLTETIKFELERLKKANLIDFEFVNNISELWLDAQQEIIIFRIFQEILQNCLKHAKASLISVNLALENEFLVIKLADNGVGFDYEYSKNQKGFNKGAGLGNLLYRAEILKGELFIDSKIGQGSKFTLKIPYKL
jgi:two-component system, NarL family, sensor kinase